MWCANSDWVLLYYRQGILDKVSCSHCEIDIRKSTFFKNAIIIISKTSKCAACSVNLTAYIKQKNAYICWVSGFMHFLCILQPSQKRKEKHPWSHNLLQGLWDYWKVGAGVIRKWGINSWIATVEISTSIYWVIFRSETLLKVSWAKSWCSTEWTAMQNLCNFYVWLY